MIFSEIHGAYYRAVAEILRAAVKAPVTPRDIRRIARETAFSESAQTIEAALLSHRWQLLRGDGTTPIRHEPTLPYTTLEKRWLKAISLDPRIRLFDFDCPGLEEVKPLFTPEDIYVFDKYADGDPYTDEGYIERFRTIRKAIGEKKMLRLALCSREGRRVSYTAFPVGIEYSEKDDKFRLQTLRTRGASGRYGYANLGRISSVDIIEAKSRNVEPPPSRDLTETLTLEITDGRRALDRALLHFAHFEKEAERLDGGRYRLRLIYDKRDETELLIRVLSFGPFIKVTEPESFVSLIRERLIRQKDLL